MLAFLIILLSGISGYVQLPIAAGLAAVVALASLSLAEHQVMLRRALSRGHADLAVETLVRSFAHALVAAGGCYLAGRVVRWMSGL